MIIVEDEKKIANFINKGLREAGFEVEICRSCHLIKLIRLVSVNSPACSL
jgi:DNA-binding response OmpR family regulator